MTRGLRVALRWCLPPLAVLAVLWVVRSLDPRAVWRTAREADAYWLAASIVPLVLRFLVWGVKAGTMMRREGAMTTAAATGDILVGAFLNLVTPTAKVAGGLYRSATVRSRTGWRFSTAYGWVFADQLTNTIGSVGLFGGLAVAAAPVVEDDTLASALRLTGIAALVVLVGWVASRSALWWLVHRPGFGRFLSRWRPLWSTRSAYDPDARPWWESWLAPALDRRSGGAAGAGDLALSALSWAMLCLGNALVFRALGVDASIPLLAAALSLGTFAGGFAGMGGIGFTEAALVGLYTQIGVSGPQAGAAALLHRASYYGVILIGGGVAFLVRRRTHTTPAARS